MFLDILDNFGIVGLIIVIVLLFTPYMLFRYSQTHKSQKRIDKEMKDRDFIGSFKLKFVGVRGSRWISEVRMLIERDKRLYPVFDYKDKIVTVYYEEEVDQKGLRNLLLKIGYSVEIVK